MIPSSWIRRSIGVTIAVAMLVLATSVQAQRSRYDRGDRSDRYRNGSRATTHSSTADSDEYSQQYAAIFEHNIFLRDRRPRQSERNSGPRAPSDPDAGFVLTGVTLEDDEYTAYIEDVRAGRLLRVHPGDPVSQGHVVYIDLDAIAYDRNGTTRWIDVGSNLAGGVVSSVSDARVNAALSGAAPAGAEGGGAIDPNAANLSIEERMRLRRLQEVGGPPPQEQPQPPSEQNAPVGPEQQGPLLQEAPPPPDAPPQSGNLSLEEQMRLRREQEQNQGR